MILRVSKHLDVPAHARTLIEASAFPSVFKLYIVLVWGVLLYLSMPSGFNLSNQYDSIKIFNDGQKRTTEKKNMKQNLRTNYPE